jgi:hypothetical protein
MDCAFYINMLEFALGSVFPFQSSSLSGIVLDITGSAYQRAYGC